MWQGINLFLAVAAFVAFLHTVSGDDPVVVITQTTPLKDPVDDYVKCPKDADALFTCAVTNKPIDSDVKWVVFVSDNRSLPISTDRNSRDPFKYNVEKPSPTAWRLKIQNVQVTDEGKYMCRVQTGPQLYVGESAVLRVTEVPRIADLQTSSDTTVKEGDNVRLTCNATGRPFPIVSWRRLAGEHLPNGGIELHDYILNIPSVVPENAGTYKCTATNFAGMDYRSIFLQVKFSPRVRAESPRVGQSPGYVKDLVCNVRAYPVPGAEQVTWSHANEQLYNSGRFVIRTIPGAYNRITSILTIVGVHSSDYGIYSCAATNEQGDQSAKIELYATDMPTPDRTGRIVSSSSTLTTGITTIIMLLFTCLLHRLNWW